MPTILRVPLQKLWKRFFERSEGMVDEYKIVPRNMWTMDETGQNGGESGHERVVGETVENCCSTAKKKPTRGEWNMTIESISASGKKIEPLCIFSGKNMWSSWLPRHLDPQVYRD